MFNSQSFKKNPWLWVLLGYLLISNMEYLFTDQNAILRLVLTIPGLLIAITFHEFAHAFVADKLGDDTPRKQGRLTLNPLAHLDPFGCIMLLFLGIGWGKPVAINPNNFHRKISVRKGNALVAIAGPAMNFILVILFSVIYGLLLKFATSFMLFNTAGVTIGSLLSYTISINIGLGVFNLIPLPPLDGSKVLDAFLPQKAHKWYVEHEQMLQVIFLVLWLTPISGKIIAPVINFLGIQAGNLIRLIIGL